LALNKATRNLALAGLDKEKRASAAKGVVGLTGVMTIYNLMNSGNVAVTKTEGVFSVIEHETDLSLSSPLEAVQQYFMKAQGMRKRQLLANLNNQGIILQNGAMQWIAGSITISADIKGFGDLVGKTFRGKVTGESAVNPLYRGTGTIFCEPTYKHLVLRHIQEGAGLVIKDGLFLACTDTLAITLVAAKSLANLAGQGLFNLAIRGNGVVALECPIPEEEIIRVDISEGEEIRVDGPFALMWEEGLSFTVERSSRTLLGSAASGEGLVNVFRGRGSVWLATASAGVKPTVLG
jgi:uncharacterized protein (AIM24 family)